MIAVVFRKKHSYTETVFSGVRLLVPEFRIFASPSDRLQFIKRGDAGQIPVSQYRPDLSGDNRFQRFQQVLFYPVMAFIAPRNSHTHGTWVALTMPIHEQGASNIHEENLQVV